MHASRTRERAGGGQSSGMFARGEKCTDNQAEPGAKNAYPRFRSFGGAYLAKSVEENYMISLVLGD